MNLSKSFLGAVLALVLGGAVATLVSSGTLLSLFTQAVIYAVFALGVGLAAVAVAKLNAAINKILKTPEIKNKLTDMGAEVMGGTSAEFAKFTAAEVKRYEAIVKNSGAPKE